MNQSINQFSPETMAELNRIANAWVNPPRTKGSGTRTYYSVGKIENKSYCFTRAKANHKGRFGFFSWVQTYYKNGRTIRTKFALSATKAKAEARAKKFYDKAKGEEK